MKRKPPASKIETVVDATLSSMQDGTKFFEVMDEGENFEYISAIKSSMVMRQFALFYSQILLRVVAEGDDEDVSVEFYKHVLAMIRQASLSGWMARKNLTETSDLEKLADETKT